jgi:hypothetical protein
LQQDSVSPETDAGPRPDLRDLIERVAAFEHGLGFLHRADLDCVAVTLGIHPFVVAEARRLLEIPGERARLIEEVRRARAALRALDPAPVAPTRAQGSPPRPNVRRLIRAARSHPLGLEFLQQAPFETVAVTLRVHPFLVLQARTLLDRRRSRGRNP